MESYFYIKLKTGKRRRTETGTKTKPLNTRKSDGQVRIVQERRLMLVKIVQKCWNGCCGDDCGELERTHGKTDRRSSARGPCNVTDISCAMERNSQCTGDVQ